MKAISLWQPYASLISCGVKTIETRSWSTPYRGEIAIHAAIRWTREEKDLECEWPFGDVLPTAFWNDPPLGCVIALATLCDCRQVNRAAMSFIVARLNQAEDEARPSEYHFGHYEQGRWMWMLRDVRPIEPVYLRGMQGLWDVDISERVPA